jgi:hypothetical protein
MSIKYHSTQPQNFKSEYVEQEIIDFVLSFPNDKIESGSIRINADIEIVDDNNEPINDIITKKIFMNGFVGSHSLFDNVNCSTDLLGNLETLSYYNRLQSTKAIASLTEQTIFNSEYICELRCPDELVCGNMLKGVNEYARAVAGTTALQVGTIPADFSMKLDCAFNSFVGDVFVPYVKTGDMKISLRIAQETTALWGDATIGTSIKYRLSNLNCTFRSIPDDGVYSKQYVYVIKGDLKQSIQSNFNNITTKFPLQTCTSMYASFIPQSYDNTNEHDSLACHQLPNVSELQFLFNDSSNQLITYQLDNQQEILDNFVQAVGSTTNACSLSNVYANKAWGVGLPFSAPMNLAGQKLSLNLKSDVNSTAPYVMYAFFTGLNILS